MSRPAAASTAQRPRASRVRVTALSAGAVAFAVVLWGGYGHHWSWTGINGHTATLWDWLHLLLLPIAFAVLPIWLSRRTRVTPRIKSLGFSALAVFALIVLAGYVVPWVWTGFAGNRLWDWLELIALPLAVALTPVFHELRSTWSRRHTIVALAGAAVFAVIVVGGYTGGWTWTGFRGNTLWNWLHLLLLPLLLPTIVVPALMPRATAGLILVEERSPVQRTVPEVSPDAGGLADSADTGDSADAASAAAAAKLADPADAGEAATDGAAASQTRETRTT